MSDAAPAAPSRDCPLCPRLVDFRKTQRAAHPDWHNAPVPAFGDLDARLLIVGLAPGLRGANRTGRPFTGDYAGHLLYNSLVKFGFAKGVFRERKDDGLTLIDCRITNAVRCVPPANKPTPDEIKTCHRFLAAEIGAMKNLRAMLTLGTISHNSVLAALGQRRAAFPFAHGAAHAMPNKISIVNSYHCSRLNTNTGRLTTEMFESVIASLRTRIG